MTQPRRAPRAFHIMAKPSGPACNMSCEYCFYTEKSALYPHSGSLVMSDEVLEAFIRKYIASQDAPEVGFAWQGGEPTLAGLDFFRKVVKLQKQHARDKRISNAFQTNGILLNDEWCQFLSKSNFLVGLSLDGPEPIHDRYRVDRGGKPTFRRVMNALKLLKKHRVEYNALVCVTRESSQYPLNVYRFLRAHGVRFIQFIPVVERLADEASAGIGLQLSSPPSLDRIQATDPPNRVTDWSVESAAFGDFLIAVFDEWVKRDVGEVFVMNFEWALGAWAGISETVCSYAARCGDCLVLERNGDVYSCDHYVYPQFRLGNILTDSPEDIVGSDDQLAFGANKQSALTRQCRECEVLFACNGECPKHRFAQSSHGEPGHSYLCAGYHKFFSHINPQMRQMLHLLQSNRPVSDIMQSTN